MDDLFNNIINDVNFCVHIFLIIMKYLFAIINLTIGLIILVSIKKKNWKENSSNKYYKGEPSKIFQMIIGFFYLIIGYGIFFNFLLYLLLWILPEGFISLLMKTFSKYYALDRNNLDIVLNILKKNFFPILSFIALMNIILSFYYYLNRNLNKNPWRMTCWLISSITTGLLVGFSTCIPYLL